MNYRSIEDMNTAAQRMATEVRGQVDLVVGIPRSGLLAANLLCLHLDVPMTDVDGLCEGRTFETGNRFAGRNEFQTFESVLVLDDTVLTGTQLRATKRRLEGMSFPFEVRYGAIYIAPDGHRHVDHWVELVPSPRVFEWNIVHHPLMRSFCVDIDGVLCRDPTPDENDDGERYRRFLTEVEPNVVPKHRIGWLVTARLEKYRPETEQWLAEHGIEYDSLVMMDLPDKEARQELGSYAEYKAAIYESTGASLFVESEPAQAAAIRDAARRPVFCYETREMLRPGRLRQAYLDQRHILSNSEGGLVRSLASGGVHLLYRCYHLLSR